MLIDGPVSLWFMGYDHWRLQNELSQTQQHPLLSEARMQDSETKLFCQKIKYLAQKICQTFNNFDSFHIQCMQK